jgi:predicted Zn-dependent peptidase
VEFAEKNFEKSKGRIPSQKIVLKNSVKIEKRKGLDQANLVFAYHVPLAENKKSYAARLLNTLMAEGLSSRLFTEIREKRNLAYAVKGVSDINKKYAYNIVYIGTSKENISKVKELILEEFEKVSKELSEEELEHTKEHLIGNYLVSREDSREQMVSLLYAEVNGIVEQVYEFEKNVRAVKLKDVKEMAKIKKHSFFALVPE